MSKHYRITFSAKDETIPATDESGKKLELKVRDIEKAFLCSMFDACGAGAKKIEEQRLAADNWANVEAVKSDADDASILLSEQDLKQVLSGIEITAGRRPYVWNRLRALIAQVEKPTEELVR